MPKHPVKNQLHPRFKPNTRGLTSNQWFYQYFTALLAINERKYYALKGRQTSLKIKLPYTDEEIGYLMAREFPHSVSAFRMLNGQYAHATSKGSVQRHRNYFNKGIYHRRGNHPGFVSFRYNAYGERVGPRSDKPLTAKRQQEMIDKVSKMREERRLRRSNLTPQEQRDAYYLPPIAGELEALAGVPGVSIKDLPDLGSPL